MNKNQFFYVCFLLPCIVNASFKEYKPKKGSADSRITSSHELSTRIPFSPAINIRRSISEPMKINGSIGDAKSDVLETLKECAKAKGLKEDSEILINKFIKEKNLSYEKLARREDDYIKNEFLKWYNKPKKTEIKRPSSRAALQFQHHKEEPQKNLLNEIYGHLFIQNPEMRKAMESRKATNSSYSKSPKENAGPFAVVKEEN